MDAAVGMGGPGKDGFTMYKLPDPPTPPPGLSGENLASWTEAANAQYAKRFQQFFDNQDSMNKAMLKGTEFNINGQKLTMQVSTATGGTWTNPLTGATQAFDEGVVCAVVPKDAPAWAQEMLGPPGTKVPVPGDGDGFTFLSNLRRAPDGSIRSLSSFPAEQAARIQAQEEAAQQALQQGAVPGIVHEGNTPNWQPPTPQKAAVKACIMKANSMSNANGENLIWVDSNGSASVGRWPGYSEAPPGYDAPAPGSGGAPPGYDSSAPSSSGYPGQAP
jgi:hypothetical protein